jgi:hypothetical protein
MKNKLHIVNNEEKPFNEQEEMAWLEVQRYYLQLKTLDEINSKPMKRAGKQMKNTMQSLLYAISIYDHIRGKQ